MQYEIAYIIFLSVPCIFRIVFLFSFPYCAINLYVVWLWALMPNILLVDVTSLFNIASNWNIVQESLNRDLIKLSDWSNKWLISFNASKTVYMEISNKPCASQIVLKLNEISTRVTSHKHPGLVLNSAFIWSDHFKYNL